jgi:SAM-dependent methyltransferase
VNVARQAIFSRRQGEPAGARRPAHLVSCHGAKPCDRVIDGYDRQIQPCGETLSAYRLALGQQLGCPDRDSLSRHIEVRHCLWQPLSNKLGPVQVGCYPVHVLEHKSIVTRWASPTTDEMEAQARYHHDLFAPLHDWPSVWALAVEMAGDTEAALGLGLDQLGHFGPSGVELVASHLVRFSRWPPSHVVELGSGFGGALRHMARLLRATGLEPMLSGVDFVPEHCALARAIGRALGETAPRMLTADVRELPFESTSVDAVFACGSASHFADMRATLGEAQRVLRPGGIVVMTEEVSLRPHDALDVADEFLRYHPRQVFPAATPEQRRGEFAEAGFTVETFDPLTGWATQLLRERVQALRFLGGCAIRMFGATTADALLATLTSAALEYERGTVVPTLIVGRRSR